MKSTANMHPFYRLFFSKLDPLIMIYSAYRNILTNTSANTNTSALGLYDLDEELYYINSTYHSPNQQQQTFALVAALATMAALVQHYSDDYNLWRIVQLVLLVWNFSFFGGTTYWWWWRGNGTAVGVEGVYCTEVLTLLILARIAFLVGFGTRGRRVIRNGVLYDGWI
ncbi:hypothetical protein HDV57DRAFT_248249 [Trichoderma longibrachiatum]